MTEMQEDINEIKCLRIIPFVRNDWIHSAKAILEYKKKNQKMKLFSLLLSTVIGYYVDDLPEPNENLQIFGLPMGHGESTIIMCPINEDGSGGEISIYDLGTIVKYYEWWDVSKLLKNTRRDIKS